MAAIQRALTAMGGIGAIQASRTCIATGTLEIGSSQERFVLKNGNAEFAYEFKDEKGALIEAHYSAHGKPATLNSSGRHRFLRHASYVDFPPHLVAAVLLRRFLDADASITYRGTADLPSGTADLVQLSITTDDFTRLVTPQSWYFDRNTGLPVRVDYLAPDLVDTSKTRLITATFSGYSANAGVQIPATVTLKPKDSDSQLVYSFTSVQVGATVADSDFDGGAN